MYRIYVSCGVCLVLVTSAQAGYFNFDRPEQVTMGHSVVASVASEHGGQASAAAAVSAEGTASGQMANAGPDVGTAGSCCERDRSCCRDLWASYCDDLPGCDAGLRRCGRGLGGIFSCEPACAPSCCMPKLPRVRLPKFRLPTICLPSWPCWGRPVLGCGLCANPAPCDGGCAAGCADATINQGEDATWVDPVEPTQASPVDSKPANAPSVSAPRRLTPPASGQVGSRSEAPPVPRSSPAADVSSPAGEVDFDSAIDEDYSDTASPANTTPAAAPQAEAEESGDLLESEGDELLESAQYRSILRSLQSGVR